MQNRRESNIERWETVKVLMSETMTTKDGTEVGISLVVNRPVFKDGNEGFPKASVVIARNGSSFRIPFFKGSAEEPESILDLFGKAVELWHETGHDEYEGYVDEHRSVLDARRQRDIDDHDQRMKKLASESGKNRSGVGTGLSRFTKESKRDRRRRKRERNQDHYDNG